MKVTIETRLTGIIDKTGTSRYALDQALIDITADGCWLSATDGKCAAIIPVKVDDVDQTVHCQHRIPFAVLPTVKTGDTLTHNGQWQSRRGKFAPLVDMENANNFPPMKEILPDIDSGYDTIVTIDAKRLLDLARAVNTSGREIPDAVTLFFKSGKKPLAVLGNVGIGVIMPVSTPETAKDDYRAGVDAYRATK